jgi:tetratricopeptide (TPR) repeat protein
VEAVAWISEQKSTLSAMFYLAAVLLYLRFDRTRQRSHYAAALALFLCALLGKTVTATLPAALLLIFWFERGRIVWKRDAVPLLPWFGLGAAAGLFTAWVERTYIGAQGAAFVLTPVERCLVAGRAIWFYLGKVLWPRNLMFFYPRWTIDSQVWWQYLFPLGAVALAVALAIVARKRRGPLAGFLFFAGTLFPALGFFNVYPFVFSYVADHFQYLATLGILVPAASGLTLLANRLPLRFHRFSPALGAALALLLGSMTSAQSGIYRDADTLDRETLARNPGAWMAHDNLGKQLDREPGGIPEAIDHFRAALKINPNAAQVHHNLGILLARTGHEQEAAAELRQAVRIWPTYVDAYANLCAVLLQSPSGLADAIAQCQQALRIDPSAATAHFYLANAYSQMESRWPDAVAEFQTAIRLAGLPEARLNLAALLARMGRERDAIGEYRAALEIQPGDAEAHYDVGVLLSHIPDRLPEAIAEFRAALGIAPGHPEAHAGLALALSDTPGQMTEAIAEYQTALRQDPDLVEAHYNLGLALAKMPGRSAEAIAHLEAALRLRPDLQRAREVLDGLRRSR